ncbi:chloramphenicol phosphotransferase CPT family protein [Bacillus alkalicellulosilyticus]|uniref:chloramphenicol phosphotransferase CPT family protein n=1 Tax=Alkalihalobacterium alkalicellulosilyticum TaxID=1912214 RepID=UPI0009962E4D|nr:zeta toxin family protein [Bacillus alkalicellulosilyticus]
MNKGTIIILNGTSSSGKTSISEKMKELITEPCAYVSLDDFVGIYQEKYLHYFTARKEVIKDTLLDDASMLIINKILSLMHSSIAGFSLLGYTVIVDTVLQEKSFLEELLKELTNFPVFIIGVHCPLEELEKREIARGNREIGLAKFQYDLVHNNRIYDFEVDTFANNSTECALEITQFLEGNEPYAFDEMRNRLNKEYSEL